MDRDKIDAQFAAGVQQVTEAYQNLRRTCAIRTAGEGEVRLAARIGELFRENERLRQENERLTFKINQLRSILGRTEDSDVYTRTDPEHDVLGVVGPEGGGWPDPAPWGERG